MKKKLSKALLISAFILGSISIAGCENKLKRDKSDSTQESKENSKTENESKSSYQSEPYFSSKDKEESSDVESKPTSENKTSKPSILTNTDTEAQETNVQSEPSTADNTTTTINTETNNNDKAIENSINALVGAYECAYLELNANGLASTDYKISYRKIDSSTYTSIDNQLIRLNDNIIRADILGLMPGKYAIKIENTKANTQYISYVNVARQDRSGYAHFNTTEGVGAYNNDGTLKTGTNVVYVTNETKNTVKATISGKEYEGISAILCAQSSSNVPLDIRILDTIGAATWNTAPDVTKYDGSAATTTTVKGNNGEYLALQNYSEDQIISGGFNTLNEETYTKLNGLTNKIKYDSNKQEFDSYYNMLDIKGAKNVTVEGVGNDAGLFQWGFTWKSDCKSIEVKNLNFDDYTEDACSFEGTADENTTSFSAFAGTNYWIHHNTFQKGVNYWDVCSEQDKGDGDGATDFKKCAYVTIAYNHYIENHKTGLVGGGNSDKTACLTFHHNYYDKCQARLPFARQANMHMYNNYYANSTGNNMQIYAGAYAFIENCYFDNIKTTFLFDSKGYGTPAVKSYNNIFNNCSNYSGATIVTDRATAVTNGNVFDQSFDTNTDSFYYDKDNHVSDVEILHDTSDVPNICKAYSGHGDAYYNTFEVDEDALNSAKTKAINNLTASISSGGTYYSAYLNKKTEYDNLLKQYKESINAATTINKVNTLYNEALTDFANLNKVSYTVTFMVDNSVYTTKTAYSGEELEYPNSPEKSGSLFQYWADKNGNKFTGNVTDDITLYAVFEELLNYDSLKNNTNNIIAWDFNNSTANQKLSTTKDTSTIGIYGTTNNVNDTEGLCYGIYTGSAIQTVDTDADGAAVMGVTLGQEYNSGIIKGYLDLKIGAYIGSKWKLLSFLNNTGEVISFGLNGDKNWAYTLDGGTTWLDLDTSIAGAANTTYNIYFQFDLDNGTVTLYFNNVLYLNAKQVNVKSISCFQTMTNGKGTGDSARVVTLDNIAIVKED